MSEAKNTTTVFEEENALNLNYNLDCATLLARRELWLLVSVGIVDPSNAARIALLRDPAYRERVIGAAALLREECSTSMTNLGPGEQDSKAISPEELFAAFDAERETLEASYRRMFGLTAISQRCPACGVEYEPNADVTYRSQRMADVGGFYQAFGLQISDRAGERLDHITVETEFLYLLLAKEAAAHQEGNNEGAEVCREARSKFFQEHVGWWLPGFSRLLAHTTDSEFYRRLAKLAAALSALERVSLGLPVFETPALPMPSRTEAPGDCAGCPSSSPT